MVILTRIDTKTEQISLLLTLDQTLGLTKLKMIKAQILLIIILLMATVATVATVTIATIITAMAIITIMTTEETMVIMTAMDVEEIVSHRDQRRILTMAQLI